MTDERPSITPADDPYEFDWPDDAKAERAAEREKAAARDAVRPAPLYLSAIVIGVGMVLAFMLPIAVVTGQFGWFIAFAGPVIIGGLVLGFLPAVVLATRDRALASRSARDHLRGRRLPHRLWLDLPRHDSVQRAAARRGSRGDVHGHRRCRRVSTARARGRRHSVRSRRPSTPSPCRLAFSRSRASPTTCSTRCAEEHHDAIRHAARRAALVPPVSARARGLRRVLDQHPRAGARPRR